MHKPADDGLRFSNDPEFDRKLNQMLREVGSSLQEQDARAQAMAAAGMLSLMGLVDFETLDEQARAAMAAFVFKLSCYAIAGMPLVQRAVSSIRGLTKERAVRSIVRGMGLIFEEDPRPLIAAMLGTSDQEEGDLASGGTQ